MILIDIVFIMITHNLYGGLLVALSREIMVNKQMLIDIKIKMQDKYHKAISLIDRSVSLQAFEKYILNSAINKNELFKAIRQAETQDCPRFNIWRLLLNVIPISGNWQEKKAALQASRKRWSELKQQSKTGPKPLIVKQTPVHKNPLMKNILKTEKKQVDSDPFLNEQIKKDVDRTYQEMQFFQESSILKLLTSVLFVWCKLNPDISYKQGMNELLASIVYVYFQEVVPSDFEITQQVEQKFKTLNSITYAEADIFAIFQKIMEIQKYMYKQSLDEKVKGQVNPNSKNNSPILQRIIQIQDHKLKSLDLQLFRIIKLQDVKTKTFLLRWIRCLHTREFGLVDSLPIWDSILLDNYESPNSKQRKQFQFVDAMCIAMFIFMRHLVFKKQTSNEILQIYSKYQKLEGIELRQLIALAWSVCEQLRALNNNYSHSSNWFEDSGKHSNLGLMINRKDQEIKPKETKNKLEVLQRQQNIRVQAPKKDLQIPQTKQQAPKTFEHSASPNNHKQIEKSKQKESEKIIQKKAQIIIAPKIRKQIIFEYQQVKLLIQSLKKSIALNDDIQSRSLANQVMKSLQEKLKK